MNQQWLTVAGLMIGLAGAWILASILLASQQKALDLGTTVVAGDTDEENLKLPMVRMFLQQTRRTALGMVLITASYLLQIAGSWPQ